MSILCRRNPGRCDRLQALSQRFTDAENRWNSGAVVAHVFKRAVERAGILTGDVTLHTLRHTVLSRMIAGGLDDYTVMEVSGHSSRMLARYTVAPHKA